MRKKDGPLLLLCCAVALISFSGGVTARGAEKAPVVINIGVPKAPPALPVLRMVEAGALRDRAEITIHIWGGTEQLVAMVQDGNYQMFAFPLTVAAKLYNKGVGIRLTNVNTWGVTYFVTSDPDFKDWGDLKGKTLFAPPRTSTPDALTHYFLDQAGLKPGRDLELVNAATSELGQLLRAGRVEYAVVLEPQVSAALLGNPDLRVAFSFEEKWQAIKGADKLIPNAGLGATTAFLEAHPDLAREFEKEYAEALAWTLANPEEAGKLAAKHFGLKAEVIASAMPRLGMLYRDAPAAANDVEDLFRLLHDFSPETIGKKIPDAALYWK